MKTVADTLGVSRSNLIDRLEHRTEARGPYRKTEDAALLPLIRAVVDERLTYGYRRVTALVNRQLRQHGKPTVNAKRVLRIMRRHALTLERHTGLPSSRTHDGKIIVLASNLRWCSDHLELNARNGEVVRVLFVIDACDREIIAWSAVASAGISGEMVRDLGRLVRLPASGASNRTIATEPRRPVAPQAKPRIRAAWLLQQAGASRLPTNGAGAAPT